MFIGIDVGGTKISLGLIDSSGRILARNKIATPKKAKPQDILDQIIALLETTLKKEQVASSALAGIGIGIPGIVAADMDAIVATPNIDLAGIRIGQKLKETFKVKTFAGNDVNLGLLGEKWLGAGQAANNIIGLFPGTGVGGGIILNGQLVTGTRGAAAEIGHMIMELNGPLCTCGNTGCLEAITGRWAIERDIRAAVQAGKKTVITELTEGNLNTIKSKVLKEALKQKDPLATKIMQHVSQTLGKACISLKHIFNPELIIFGGGVIEACGDFMLPIIRETTDKDPFFHKEIDNCQIVTSLLGDDAVMLGAVFLAAERSGQALCGKNGMYPIIQPCDNGKIKVNDKVYKNDFYIRADGKIKDRDDKDFKKQPDSFHRIGVEELQKICKKNPNVVFIGTGENSCLEVTKDGKDFLVTSGIELQIFPTPQAIQAYNETASRKAMLVHMTC